MTPETIAELLDPYLANTSEPAGGWSHLYAQLSLFLALILKWNVRTNLTAIRQPDEIVRRHFGESLFLASHLGPCETLLDLGSGAGFPGIPVQLMRPDIRVTLAESQGKKASFLREAVRSLALTTEVWAARAETMPENRQFHTVTLRAVDDMKNAIREAAKRSTHRILILGKSQHPIYTNISNCFLITDPIPIPKSTNGILLTATRL